jgi:bacillithiol biosynthesis cysteine-adding enzyme BshC
MKVEKINLTDTPFLHPLIEEYLSGKKELTPFYTYAPDISAVSNAIADRKKIEINRSVLKNTLSRQYEQLLNQKPFEEVKRNIQILSDKNSFTVTTGHQLNIFTGPLYFVYKIISVLKYAKELTEHYPDYHFVPVYWMASEDHDFEEINHMHLWGRTLKWQTGAKGAVGRFNPQELQTIIDELAQLMGERGEYLLQLFRDSYLKHNTLAAATRFLVHSLFGKYGLVCLDADEKELKQLFIPFFQQDLVRQNVEKAVSETQKKLSEYKLPVNPRKINVFYLIENGRYRIIDEDGFFQVKELGKKWKVDELLEELEQHPEHFSPNVVLRPLYQEVILPNLAYIGGTNEIAYWFELKQVFDLLHVFFPQLLIRDSAICIGKKVIKDIHSLGIHWEDAFLSMDQLKAKYFESQELIHPAETEIDNIITEYDRLRDALQNLDNSLVSGIVKNMNEHIKDAKKWKGQIRTQIESQEEKNLQKLEKIHSAVFPDGEFQERHDNFIGYYLQYGSEFFRLLMENFAPSNAQLKVFIDE